MPRIKRITHIAEKRKTSNLAIAAAPAALSVVQNTDAASAMTKKITAQRSIDFTSPRDESKQPIAARGCHGDQTRQSGIKKSCPPCSVWVSAKQP